MLNEKQAAFAKEYIIDLNATRAAIRAGYSEKTAKQIGSRLLTNVDIAAAIQAAMNKRAEVVELTAENVLREIGKLAFADIRKVFDADGNLLPVTEMPEEIVASIASIEVVTNRAPGKEAAVVDYTSKIRFWDKRASLELAGKHLKLFTDKVEHTGKDGGPIQYENLTDEQIDAKLAGLMTKSG